MILIFITWSCWFLLEPPPPDPARFDGMIDALTCTQSRGLLLQSLRGEISDPKMLEEAVNALLAGEVGSVARGGHKMGVSLQAASMGGMAGRRLSGAVDALD